MVSAYRRRVRVIKQLVSASDVTKQLVKYFWHDIKVVFIALFTLVYSVLVLFVSLTSVIFLPVTVLVYPYIAALTYRSNVKSKPNPFSPTNIEGKDIET